MRYDITRKVKLLYNGEKVEKTLSFKEIDYNTAKEVVIKNHYSHKWNTGFGKVNIGVFENDKLLGVASFGNLMNPKSFKTFNKEFKQENVIELNRLWVDDILGGNTETILMKASFDIIKKKYPHIKAVQSFADGRLGCGTIYKAMNFKYYGYSETLFYEHKNGKTFHKVPMSNTKRPDGLIKLNYAWYKGDLRPFKVKTYRYVYPLYKDIKIEMEEKEYPKYNIGVEYLDETYKHNVRLRLRAYVLAFILDYSEFEYFRTIVKLEEVRDIIKEKSILEIAAQRNVLHKIEFLELLLEVEW